MRFGNKEISLSSPAVMGVLNTTPDSFSDGGKFYRGQSLDLDAAYDQAQAMVERGAIFIDIGGESTRPGAQPVSSQQEMDRVLPLVQRLAGNCDCIISVDSSNPRLMREAAKCGAGMLNDVRALQVEGALQAASESGLAVCIMHMQGQPDSMQRNPQYSNVVEQVCGFLQLRLRVCSDAGIDRSRIMVDPGFGFGKTLQHNLLLLSRLGEFAALEVPVLVGMSRKSMIGELTGKPVDQRLSGGLALATAAVLNGASIIRTHDVAETVDAVKIATALRKLADQSPA